jgi:TPR repeat protein
MTTISNFDQNQMHGSDALQGSEMPVPENDLQSSHFSAENIRLYRVAADQGNGDAMITLGYCYSTGSGVNRDLAEAVWWFRRAARLGSVDAMVSLSVCCRDGIGTGKDTRESVRWVRRALKGFGQSQAQKVRRAE